MDQTFNLMVRGLDGAMKRQEAISNNIANANTPGYKRQDVDFKETLVREFEESNQNTPVLKTTNPEHSPGINFPAEGKFKTQTLDQFSYKNDDGSVDIDVEMSELAKNNLYYNTLVRQINSKFTRVNTVIERG